MTTAALPLSNSIFELFFDTPHPGASASSSYERARFIDPPEDQGDPIIKIELYGPRILSRVTRLAFPDFDDSNGEVSLKIDENDTTALNARDLYLSSFQPCYHTFSLNIDETRKVQAHVLRYLPPRRDVGLRNDVGRRGERAMILFTTAVGGEGFFLSVLKTLQSLNMYAISLPGELQICDLPEKQFLHNLCFQHGKLCSEHSSEYKLSCDRKEPPPKIYQLQISGIELYRTKLGSLQEHVEEDIVTFNLPESLQPESRKSPYQEEYKFLYCPMLPLLRCLGASHFIRLLSALLCESRIILVSDDVTKLSACVKGALAMLAQGLLVWRHAQIPVLAPHLFKHLSVQTPFIVGVLNKYVSDPKFIDNLTHDIIFVDLDKNELRTYNMIAPDKVIPDLLRLKKSNENLNQGESLARTISHIYKLDSRRWYQANNKTEVETQSDPDKPRPQSAPEKKKKHWLFGRGKTVKISEKEQPDQNDQTDDDSVVDVAAFFGNMLRPHRRGSIGSSSSESYHDPLPTQLLCQPKPKPMKSCEMCNNEAGEEAARVALVNFFLDLFGDMGMYFSLSPENGKFWLDKKKFLVRKKQMGLKESSSLFQVLSKLCNSVMFEKFAEERIAKMERVSKDRTSLHVPPLFALCEQYMRKNRIAFKMEHIDRVVLATVGASYSHGLINRYENIRRRALIITSELPREGNSALEANSLLADCKNCNIALAQVMCVIWQRIENKSATEWKPILLGLHLLKRILLTGPITAVAKSVNGLHRIILLRGHSNRNIRDTANQIYTLLTNLNSLWLRRRKAAVMPILPTTQAHDLDYSNYIMRRLPLNVEFRHLHNFLRPNNDNVSNNSLSSEAKVEKGDSQSEKRYDGWSFLYVKKGNTEEEKIKLDITRIHATKNNDDDHWDEAKRKFSDDITPADTSMDESKIHQITPDGSDSPSRNDSLLMSPDKTLYDSILYDDPTPAKTIQDGDYSLMSPSPSRALYNNSLYDEPTPGNTVCKSLTPSPLSMSLLSRKTPGTVQYDKELYEDSPEQEDKLQSPMQGIITPTKLLYEKPSHEEKVQSGETIWDALDDVHV